ncbi:SRPBCC family protein [Streptomyces sp. NPDC001595]|uniref:SRPBCC family protein n=1 Tax=Streptomyces sp. NPDC001532 TaxID=3154520 RepID=UPI00332FA541
MADDKATGRGSAAVRDAASKTREQVLQSPAGSRLAEELQGYVEAKVEKMVSGVGERMGSAAGKLGAAHLGPGALAHAMGKGGKSLTGRLGASALSSAITSRLSGTASHAKDTLKDTVKGAAKRSFKAHGGTSGGPKSMAIIEDVDVGVPVRVAYDQWTQFQEFSRFAKGVINVDRKDDTSTHWEVKIAKATRAFEATVTEQVPDKKIAWTSEGAKGTTKGVVTFHPLGDNLTKVLLVLQYFPKGLVEKTGNIWRAQGRRARLDLKAFRTFVMMRGEATGSWRGEIHEAKVTRGPDEEEPEKEAREEGEEPKDKEGADQEDTEQEGTDQEGTDQEGTDQEGAADEDQAEDEYEDEDEGEADTDEDEADTDEDEYEDDEAAPEDRYDDEEQEEDEEEDTEDAADTADDEEPAPARRRSRKR